MLSRSDSAASTILTKSKSNASVRECLKPPSFHDSPNQDPSRIHALIAAHRAMDRSESKATGDLSRADSSASCRTAPAGTRDSHIHFAQTAYLRRQRSALQARTPHLSAALRAHPQTRVASLHAECGFAESERFSENYGAEPSSYRKIRRTRSILTPRGRTFAHYGDLQQHTSFSQAPTLRISPKEPAANDHGLKLRLKRSINALRPTSRLSISRRPETYTANHDAVVELAREQYFSKLPKNLVRRPTSISNPKTTRRQQSLPKSIHNQQDKETTEAKHNAKRQTSETPRSDSKMRSFSTTLQNHLRRAFGVPTSPKPATNQQQQQPHEVHQVPDKHVDSDALHTSSGQFTVGEEESRCQSLDMSPKAKPPSLEEDSPFVPTLHCTVSGDSLHSNTRSRVTSWTNSTVTASSLSTLQPGLERNRLSIIKEDGGPHQPSSSAGRHLGGIRVFQEPLEKVDENGDRLPVVDSQRLYSALMKRICEEEVEMERTKASFDEITKDRNHSTQAQPDSKRSTIRAVSNVTASTQSNSDPGQENLVLETKHRSDHQDTNIALKDEPSSFFPYSGQEQSAAPSPFRKFLKERRSQETARGSSTELVAGGNVDQNQGPMRCFSGHAMRSESIYSRTTDGGPNTDYQRPQTSMDELTAVNVEASSHDLRVAIRRSPEQSKTTGSIGKQTLVEKEDKVEKAWRIKDESAILRVMTNPKTKKHHHREHAQIGPDDVEVGISDLGNANKKGRIDNRFSTLEIKEVPRNNTPAPERSSSRTKSRTGLLKRISSIELSSVIGKSEENRKVSAGSRKYSPVNIARVIRERKSQILMSREGREKENNVGDIRGNSPPISTPGRLQMQLRNGNGRLRKRRSEVSVLNREEDDTPKSFNRYLQPTSSEYDDSPTERVKQSLSARLSRPFDMDVPPGNRPFDSEYLGKRPAGISAQRLSVAPNISDAFNGYGGLGPTPFQADTALPVLENANSESGKAKGLWSSKRMVSDFLKRRRGARSSSQEATLAFL